MPEVEVTIGGRSFSLACQAGEEDFLQTAAGLLDAEATAMQAQVGRVPEARMLLMAGLMLADKTAGMEEALREAEGTIAARDARVAELESAPPPEPVEVAVVPPHLTESLAEIAARTEALALAVEEKGQGA